jgi:transposase InsO family protein
VDRFNGRGEGLSSSGGKPRRQRREVNPPKKIDLRTRRFSAAQHAHALELLASGLGPTQVAKIIGTTTQSVARWVAKAQAQTVPAEAMPTVRKNAKSTSDKEEAANKETRKLYAPRDPGQGLSEPEVAGILEWKRTHPSMGPAQLRAQLKRFKGWRLSLKAIARVLRQHGYEPVHRGSKPKGLEPPIRFEAPRRNYLWQADFAEVRVHAERLHVLIILDDFSRFVVGHALCDSPSSAAATETLKAAIARHGKPEAVRTDRGGAFVAFTKEGDFGRFLEAELIDPIRGRSYSPRGGGKVESAIGTLRRELWDLGEFADRHEAKERLDIFFDEYNHRRAHMGIDGLTPADRFFGRADQVLATIDAISRKRQGVLDTVRAPGAPIEELIAKEAGAPLEVLRLVLHDGVMELRFCGAKVTLGRIEL